MEKESRLHIHHSPSLSNCFATVVSTRLTTQPSTHADARSCISFRDVISHAFCTDVHRQCLSESAVIGCGIQQAGAYLDVKDYTEVPLLAGLLGLGHAFALHHPHIPWRHHLQTESPLALSPAHALPGSGSGMRENCTNSLKRQKAPLINSVSHFKIILRLWHSSKIWEGLLDNN